MERGDCEEVIRAYGKKIRLLGRDVDRDAAIHGAREYLIAIVRDRTFVLKRNADMSISDMVIANSRDYIERILPEIVDQFKPTPLMGAQLVASVVRSIAQQSDMQHQHVLTVNLNNVA